MWHCLSSASLDLLDAADTESRGAVAFFVTPTIRALSAGQAGSNQARVSTAILVLSGLTLHVLNMDQVEQWQNA